METPATATDKTSGGFAAHELRPCPVCSSKDFRPQLGPIQRCRGCGVGMTNPPLEIRGEYETKEYFLHEYLPVMLAHLEASMGERKWHLEYISRNFALPAVPKLLDVGCALGFMLDEATRAGWEAQGIESSEFAGQYARERTGCDVFAGTLQDARFPDNSFDVLTLMDVIEHVPEPAHLLEEVFRVLRPGGVVYIVTPNFNSLFVRLYGLGAYGIWPDQHVMYFHRQSMRFLLKETGFRRCHTATKDVYSPNLERFLHRKSHQHPEIKKVFAERPMFRTMRGVANLVFSHIPLGDKLIACAQK